MPGLFFNNNNKLMDELKNVLILDTAPLLAGMEVNTVDAVCVTVPGVVDEVKNSISKMKLETFLNSGKLKIAVPEHYWIESVKKKAHESGDIKFLSDTDIEILAVALKIKNKIENESCSENTDGSLVLITDDYSVQNTAALCGIKTAGYKLPGIKKYIKWELYCPVCKNVFKPDIQMLKCPNCGMRIRRRMKKPLRRKY